jgi:two-component system sensor histidine kinase VicK
MLDTWLQITFRLPVLVLLLIALVLLSLLTGLAVFVRSSRRKARDLVDEAGKLRAQLEGHANPPPSEDAGHQIYRVFLHNVSHEVANPLQSIQTNLDNMGSCPADEGGRWRQYHQIIAAEVLRLIGLTDRLRLLFRLESPEVPAVRQMFNVVGVIEYVIMTLTDEAESHKVSLRYVGPSRPARILGDRDGLHAALYNLVENAIKYSKPEGGQVTIRLEEEEDRLRVTVTDEGIGIPEEDLPHVFETAYRAANTGSIRRRGSGLGLAIAKRMVEHHGGGIQVSSRLGVGSEFTFDLPLPVPEPRPGRESA